jgi:hypothetical protein
MDDDEFLAKFLDYWVQLSQEQKNDFENRIATGYFDDRLSSPKTPKSPRAVLN